MVFSYCHCLRGKTGQFSFLFSACNDTDSETQACQNGGICVKNEDGSLACSCPDRYYGDHCETYSHGFLWVDKKNQTSM